VQKYGNDPAVLNVCEKVCPGLRNPESQSPFGEPGVPEVEVWPLELQLHCTVSPGWIVTDEGTKQKQLGPTITVTVAALVTVGQKVRSGAIATTTAAMRSKEVFIILIISVCRER